VIYQQFMTIHTLDVVVDVRKIKLSTNQDDVQIVVALTTARRAITQKQLETSGVKGHQCN